jgi:tRNA A-37 threonylcarbamoyl transferase component Bud32
MSALTDDASLERLAECVRRNLLVEPTSITDVGELSNINYVYRVETADSSFYLKVIPEQPKRLPVKLPRERVFSEAAGLRLYREYAGDDLVVPEVLFVDAGEMALAMSDVGGGRQILFQVIADDFQLLAEQGDAIGRALGRVHAATRGHGTPRPPQEEMIIRKVIFDGLLAPGAKSAFPELWEDVRAEMTAHNECLIHADLWSKNLLVARGRPMAVVDFEGVVYGDPAFDIGTLIAVALVPAIDQPQLLPAALDFVSRLTASWAETCGDPDWAAAVLPRTFRATATFLAARGFGPFAYVMSDAARERIRTIAHDFAANPPTDFESFYARTNSHFDR